jgi:hypothetical protein
MTATKEQIDAICPVKEAHDGLAERSRRGLHGGDAPLLNNVRVDNG